MAATVAERYEDPVRLLTRACLKPAGQPAPGLRTNSRVPTGKAPGNGVAIAIGHRLRHPRHRNVDRRDLQFDEPAVPRPHAARPVCGRCRDRLVRQGPQSSPLSGVHRPSHGAGSREWRRPVMIQAADVREWRNHDVVDDSGQRIGVLEAVYVDTSTDEPSMATVRTGLPTRRRLVFVPPRRRDRRSGLPQGPARQGGGAEGSVDRHGRRAPGRDIEDFASEADANDHCHPPAPAGATAPPTPAAHPSGPTDTHSSNGVRQISNTV